MSDTESYRSSSPSRDIINNIVSNTDDVLNDHRNQLSLPIRGTSNNVPENLTEDSTNSEVALNGRRFSHPESQTDSKAKVNSTGDNYDLEDPATSLRGNRAFVNSLRTDFLVRENDDEDDYLGAQAIPIVRGTGGSLAAAARRGRSRPRSHSVSEQIRCLVNPKEVENSEDEKQPTSGILRKTTSNRKTKYNRSNSGAENADQGPPVTKIKTNDTMNSDNPLFGKRERRPSRSSIDSEADSHASRSSQETEEDVCFPMLREHIRIKGIDFDEIEEFIKEEREEERLMKDQQRLIAERTASRVYNSEGRSNRSLSNASGIASSAALKYTPKKLLRRTTTALGKLKSYNNAEYAYPNSKKTEKQQSDSSTVNEEEDSFEVKIDDSPAKHYVYDDSSSENVKFGSTKVNDGSSILPDRFSFFSSESEETIHAPDFPSLVEPNQSVRELFKNGEGTWWLDCVCPTDGEMKMIAKAFGIHPLTAEDIRMQETREKVELFRSYYFVCFHTFEPDKESEDYLEPINVYIVVFRDGILSFHFSPVSHPANVRRRVRQLRDYVDVSADWLCYALIDDITDGFAPVITAIEYEADAIEDSVFVARELDFSNMLQRIGESRRKVMTLMRLLSGKADVIKMFAKRCQDEAATYTINSAHSNTNLTGLSGSGLGSTSQTGIPGVSFGPGPGAPAYMVNPAQMQFQNQIGRAQPRADIALYLGDIQDHVVTMFQNLLAYEKIFSRSHSNYLAQLQVESFNSNNKVTQILSKVTLIGTFLVPLNLVTGLFGMNVHVPGESVDGLGWFFGILGVMVLIVMFFFILAKIWLDKINDVNNAPTAYSSRRSIKSLGLKSRTKEAARSIISFPNKYD